MHILLPGIAKTDAQFRDLETGKQKRHDKAPQNRQLQHCDGLDDALGKGLDQSEEQKGGERDSPGEETVGVVFSKIRVAGDAEARKVVGGEGQSGGGSAPENS